MVAGAETFEGIALHGRCKQAWLRSFLELAGGVPSHGTIRRVLTLIYPDAFERCFLTWARDAFHRDPASGPEQIALDGKVARPSFDRQHGRPPLHLVSANATERGLVLAQRAVEDKGGEPAALPAMPDGLCLDGCLVSLGALSCRRDVAEHITARGADHLLTLKGNEGRVHDQVRTWFAAACSPVRTRVASQPCGTGRAWPRCSRPSHCHGA